MINNFTTFRVPKQLYKDKTLENTLYTNYRKPWKLLRTIYNFTNYKTTLVFLTKYVQNFPTNYAHNFTQLYTCSHNATQLDQSKQTTYKTLHNKKWHNVANYYKNKVQRVYKNLQKKYTMRQKHIKLLQQNQNSTSFNKTQTTF